MPSRILVVPRLVHLLRPIWLALTAEAAQERTRFVRTIVRIEEIIEPGSHYGIISFKQQSAMLFSSGWIKVIYSVKKK